MFHTPHRARRDIVTDRRGSLGARSRSPEAIVSGAHALEDLLWTLREERGFAVETLHNRTRTLRPFLAWLADRRRPWQATSAEDITAYLAAHPQWSRPTIAQHVHALRSFFRHGAARGWCRACLAEQIDAPRLYTHERLPQGPSWRDVQQLLEAARGDTPRQLRDRAMLLLLVVYGFRSSEVRRLTLDDLDWEQDDAHTLGRWVRRFLLEHLIVERNLSPHTQHSHRDTFRLLIPSVAARHHQDVDRLAVTDVSGAVLREFLRHLEAGRQCTVRTRNQRLAAVHAFATFVGERDPERIPWCGEIRAVPFKRYDRRGLCYLDKPEIDAVLAAPDRTTDEGRRDHGLVLFLYNAGARASEAAALTVGDVDRQADGAGSVRLHGKGGKTRHCPLWPTTMRTLAALTEGRAAAGHRVSESASAPHDPIRDPCGRGPLCVEGGPVAILARDEDRQSARDPAHDGDASLARRRRHQHDPRVVGTRVDRHDQHLRGGGPGDQDAGC